MADSVLVSVVIPVYNMSSVIERAILSVLDQTYNRVELIVMDGGSTDGTVDIVKKYSDKLAYWASAPDKGPSDAVSKALKYARGKYIGFLGADDWYEPYALETVAPVIEKGRADICYGNMAFHNEEDVEIKDLSLFCPEKLYVYGTQWLGAVNSFVKKELLEENYLKYNDVLMTDYLLFLRLYASGKEFQHSGFKKPITHFYYGGRSTTLKYAIIKDADKIRNIVCGEYPNIWNVNDYNVVNLHAQYEMNLEAIYRNVMTKDDYVNVLGDEPTRSNTIVLFGAGVFGRQCASMLRFMNRSVMAFVDNNTELSGKEIDGIKVYSIEYLSSLKEYTIIITPSRIYHSDIEKQLYELGVYKVNDVIKYSDLANKIHVAFGEKVLDEAYENGLIV